MGELLAAMQAFGPGGLLLRRGGGRITTRRWAARCGGCTASRRSRAFLAESCGGTFLHRTRAIGHLLPGCLSACLGDIAEARSGTLEAAAGRSGTGLERRPCTAGSPDRKSVV